MLPSIRTKKIIHCDADCFFAALEMRDDPALRGIPMAVGGDPYRRGVISTCNYEARAFGVRSALASAYAKKLCPQLIIVPHNMAKYRLAAQQLKSLFSDYSDVVEPLSLDEAFLDVSESESCKGSATLIAKEIRRRVEKEIGITVSAGVASNKFLAKVASDWNKPNGLTVIEPSRIAFFMQQLPVSCIPGVGQKTQQKLRELGIYQCADILPIDKTVLVQHFGKFGCRLYDFARGDDDRPVCAYRERKTVSVEKTLDIDLLPVDCIDALHYVYQQLQHRLFSLSVSSTFVKAFVKVTFGDFTKTSIEIKTTALPVELCEKLFYEACLRSSNAIRLVGIGVKLSTNPLQQEGGEQLALFDR